MTTENFNMIGLRGKKISIQIYNGEIFRGIIRYSFQDYLLLIPARDGSGDDPCQILISKKHIVCIYIIDEPLS